TAAGVAGIGIVTVLVAELDLEHVVALRWRGERYRLVGVVVDAGDVGQGDRGAFVEPPPTSVGTVTVVVRAEEVGVHVVAGEVVRDVRTGRDFGGGLRR